MHNIEYRIKCVEYVAFLLDIWPISAEACPAPIPDPASNLNLSK